MLFHATVNEYSPGQVLIATNPVDQYKNAVAVLELGRPLGSPSRMTCKFSTDDPVFACIYAIGQQYEREKIRLYKVEVDVFQRSPMALVHAIERKLMAGDEVSRLVTEYWRPTMEWAYFECFGPNMKIISQVEIPSFNEYKAKEKYFADANAAARM